MLTVTKRLRFSAAHRLVGHPGRCASLHGHNYDVEVTVGLHDSEARPPMVIDFSRLKQIVGSLIDDLDHSSLLAADDPLARGFVRMGQRVNLFAEPPTAEVIATYIHRTLADTFSRELGTNMYRVHRVRLAETTDSWVESTVP